MHIHIHIHIHIYLHIYIIILEVAKLVDGMEAAEAAAPQPKKTKHKDIKYKKKNLKLSKQPNKNLKETSK